MTSVMPLTWSHTSLSLSWRDGFGGWSIHWIKSWLDGCIQRVTVSGSMSGWRPVVRGGSQGSILVRVLLNIFINGSVTERTLSEFAGNIREAEWCGSYAGGEGYHLEGL